MTPKSSDLLTRLAQARGIQGATARRPAPGFFHASDGVRLHYLDWSGDPHVALLLHGGRLTARTFDLLALAMGETVRCLALDLRGHGESGWADDYTIGRMAADVTEFVEHLDVERIHLVGMSLGGCVAGHAAPRLAGKLASLAFIDVGPNASFEATARLRAFIASVRPARRIEEIVQSALAVSPRTDPDLMLYRYRALLRQTPQGYYWKSDARRPTDFPHILAALGQLWDIAPQIDCATLVVKGGRSSVLTLSDVQGFAQRFVRGEWRVSPDAGHNIQEDAPRDLAAILLGHFHRACAVGHNTSLSS